jgi:hypothetical protein
MTPIELDTKLATLLGYTQVEANTSGVLLALPPGFGTDGATTIFDLVIVPSWSHITRHTSDNGAITALQVEHKVDITWYITYVSATIFHPSDTGMITHGHDVYFDTHGTPEAAFRYAVVRAVVDKLEYLAEAKPAQPISWDNTVCADEGWCISDSDGSENGPWQLQRVDEMSAFTSDDAAWVFVFNMAKEGSALHQRALDFLKANNPKEFDAIHKFVAAK